jgi:hypothetical protein
LINEEEGEILPATSSQHGPEAHPLPQLSPKEHTARGRRLWIGDLAEILAVVVETSRDTSNSSDIERRNIIVWLR